MNSPNQIKITIIIIFSFRYYYIFEMAENDETSDKNLSSAENTKTSQQIEESQNMSEDQKKLGHRYNREEMLEIRENKFSRTRPKELSKEFDK